MKNTLFTIIYILALLTGSLKAQTIDLFTPNGTVVKGFYRDELTQSEITTITQQTAAEFPNATVLANASRTYNCHSYAFNLSEGGSNVVWVNATHNGAANLVNYWLDGSYLEVCNDNIGDKIHYFIGDHTAIKSPTVAGMYESKWGEAPRMRHAPTDVPSSYQGSNRKYYKRVELRPVNGTCGTSLTVSLIDIGATSYNWSSSSRLSGGGSSATAYFTKLDNGSATVSVRGNFTGCTTPWSTINVNVTGIISGTVSQSGQPDRVLVSTMSVVGNSQATVNLNYLPNPSSISVSKLSGPGSWSYNSSTKTLTFTIPSNSNASFSVSGSGNTCGNISRSLTFYAPSSLVGDDSGELSAGSLFPNPTSDFVNVQLNKDDTFFRKSSSDQPQEKMSTIIQLQNTEGKIIRSVNPLATDSFVRIDISDLTSGVYFIVIKRNGEIRTEKIVKN